MKYIAVVIYQVAISIILYDGLCCLCVSELSERIVTECTKFDIRWEQIIGNVSKCLGSGYLLVVVVVVALLTVDSWQRCYGGVIDLLIQFELVRWWCMVE